MRISGPGLFFLASVSALFVNCGGGNPQAAVPTAPSATPAGLTLSMAPNPIIEDPRCVCGGLPNRVSATGRLTIRETQGIGVRIDGMRATAQQVASGATTFTTDFTAADVGGHAGGSNRVAPSGALEIIDVGGHYDRSMSGSATMRIDVRGTDDRGNAITATLSVPIGPAP